MSRAIRLVLTLMVFAGCSSYTVAKYGVSPETVSSLRTHGGQKVNVGPFSAKKAGLTEIGCRAVGPIKSPDGKPFEAYVRQALIDELRVAELFGEAAPLTLTGNLNELEFSSTSGKWILDLTLTSSNGRALNAREEFSYETSFVGEKGCALTAQAFPSAVQSLIGKLVRNPEFSGLLR
jgi:hypothetical protein